VFYEFRARRAQATDQFETKARIVVPGPLGLRAPAARDGQPAPRLDGLHLVSYAVQTDEPTEGSQSAGRPGLLQLDGPLGAFVVRAEGPAREFLVPTAKRHGKPPPAEDPTQSVPHYLCYAVHTATGDGLKLRNDFLTLTDQFAAPRRFRLRPTQALLCNPAQKNDEEVENPRSPHLLCLAAAPAQGQEQVEPSAVLLHNQFGLFEETPAAVRRVCAATLKRHREQDKPGEQPTYDPATPEPQ
jgi:hypothetical protein